MINLFDPYGLYDPRVPYMPNPPNVFPPIFERELKALLNEFKKKIKNFFYPSSYEDCINRATKNKKLCKTRGNIIYKVISWRVGKARSAFSTSCKIAYNFACETHYIDQVNECKKIFCD